MGRISVPGTIAIVVIGDIWSRKEGLHLQRGLPTPKCPIMSTALPPVASRQRAIELHHACEGFRVSQRGRRILAPLTKEGANRRETHNGKGESEWRADQGRGGQDNT
jgi:hypothetical protein